jgi:hypothetical protein
LTFDLTQYEETLQYWIVHAALTSRFDAAVNTRVVAEFRELVRTLRRESAMAPPSISGEELVKASRRGTASIWKGVEILLRLQGPVDLPGALLPVSMKLPQSRSFVLTNVRQGNTRAYDPAMGMVMLSGATGHSVEGLGAANLYSHLESADTELVQEFLETQLLPDVEAIPALDDNLFLSLRAQRVIQKMISWHDRVRRALVL